MKKVLSWQEFADVKEYFFDSAAPMPEIHWQEFDAIEARNQFLLCWHYDDEDVRRGLTQPVRRFSMSHERRLCEEVTKSEMDAVKKCLSAEDQHRLRVIQETLHTENEKSYVQAMHTVSRMVIEGRPEQFIEVDGKLITGRDKAVLEAAEWLKEHVLNNSVFA